MVNGLKLAIKKNVVGGWVGEVGWGWLVMSLVVGVVVDSGCCYK